jgi:hypothetical protein
MQTGGKMLSDRSKISIILGSGFLIVCLLAWAGILEGVDVVEILLVVLIIAFVLLRWWLGCVIGGAAAKRNCGRTGWVICSLLFGPLLVWIVYLILVHWRPIAMPLGAEQEPSVQQ